MARLWWDGFEYGSDTPLAQIYPSAGMTVEVAPYSGSYCVKGTTGVSLTRTLTSAKAELYVKFHFVPASVVITSAVVGFYKGSTCIGWLRQVNRDLELYCGTGTGTLLGTAVNALLVTAGSWNLIEVRWKVGNDPDGIAQVRVNEALVIDEPHGDTQPGADANMDGVRLGTAGGTNNYNNAKWDDFIIDDANWVGNKRVAKISPTGAGTTTQWDPSTGANWSCVDEVPYSDTDFISTNVSDEIDTYACSDLPVTATAAKGLMIVARVVEEGTATPQNVQLAVRSDGTNYFGASQAPPSGSAVFIYELWPDDPAEVAGTDWTVARVNAVEIGIKAVA
jgi:hypothetical protein